MHPGKPDRQKATCPGIFRQSRDGIIDLRHLMRVCSNGKEEISADVIRLRLRFEMRIGSLSLYGKFIEATETFRRASGDFLGIGMGMYIEYSFHRSGIYARMHTAYRVLSSLFIVYLDFFSALWYNRDTTKRLEE